MTLDTSRGISSRRPEIDGLRALAVLAVFAFHSYPGPFFWAWTGVDLFFVLSGFLITGIILKLPSRDLRGSFRSFYARRALRIWPVYYLTLAGTTAYFLLRSLSVHPASVVRSLFFMQFTNLYSGYRTTPHVIATFLPTFTHSWSVAVEEQFYFIWPLVVICLRRRPRALLGTCAALLVTGCALRSAGVAPYLLLTRPDGLALGAALAVLSGGSLTGPMNGQSRAVVARLSAGALIVSLPVIAWYLVRGYVNGSRLTPMDHSLHPLVVSGASLLFFGVVGLMVLGRLPALTKLLSHPFPVYVGGISYAIYMFHPMVLLAVRRGLGHSGGLAVTFAPLLALGVTVAAAHVSMRCLEGPILQLKRRFPVRQSSGEGVRGLKAAG